MQKQEVNNKGFLGRVRTWVAKKNQTRVVHYKMVLTNRQVIKGIEVYDGWTGYDKAIAGLQDKLQLQARNFFNAQVVYIEMSKEQGATDK